MPEATASPIDDPILQEHWSQLEHDDRVKSRTQLERIHLVVSLILFLQLPFAPFILFLFRSTHPEVVKRAGTFLRHQGNASPTSDSYFPAATLYNLWHKRSKAVREYLHDLIIEPCAKDIVAAESDRAVRSVDLRLKISTLTMAAVRDALYPGRLLDKYRELVPFTFGLLLAFSTRPNRYRKYNLKENSGKTSNPEDDEDKPADPADDDGLEEDEILNPEDEDSSWEDWRKDPQWSGFSRCPLHAIVLVISILLFVRNRATNFLPVILGVFLKIGGAGTRIIRVFSKLGVCVTDKTVETIKLQLSKDAVQLAVDYILSGKLFFIIFDNINLYLRKYEQTLGNKNRMLHATNAAIMPFTLQTPQLEDEATNLNNWLGTKGKRSEADPADFQITKKDSNNMKDAFKALIVQLIVSYSPGSKLWPKYSEFRARATALTPKIRPLPVEKTATLPFGVFDVNEGSRKGVLDMMDQLQEKSTLSRDTFSSKARVVEGDWLTVNNLRLGQRERTDDTTGMNRVEYAMPLGALWHTGFNAVKNIVKTHKGQDVMIDPASLGCHKQVLDRTWDINSPDFAAARSLIRTSLISRVLHIVMCLTSMTTILALTNWRPTFDEIVDLASKIVAGYTTTSAADAAIKGKDEWLGRSILFIRDALLFCEFESAVSFADAGRVLDVLKFWVYSFRGAGSHNYARECLEVLMKWKYELTPAQRLAMERAWFVNKWGLPGRWIAADLYIEHLNYWIKRVFAAQGSNLTEKYIMEKGSACVEAFHELSHRVSQLFGDKNRSRRHKEVKFARDIEALILHMLARQVHTLTEGRFIPLLEKTKKAATTTKTAKQPEPKIPDVREGPGKLAVVDIMKEGMISLNAGKFQEFLRETTLDPRLGYPLSGTASKESSVQDSDNSPDNPLDGGGTLDDGEGYDEEPACPGVGGLGAHEYGE